MMAVRYFLAFLQELTGLYGIVVNLVVLRFINACDQLSYFTLTLIKTQCVVNLIGLIPLVFYSPWALAFATNFLQPGSFAMNAVTSVVTFSLYCQLSLQALMAVNRFTLFQYPERMDLWFTNRRVNLLITLCIIYGCTNGIPFYFDCCNAAYFAQAGRWGPNGTHVHIQGKVQFLFGEMTYFPILIGCQIGAVLGIDKLRKQVTDKKMNEARLKMEMRLMFQFLLIAIVWVMLSGFWRILQFVPSARGHVTGFMVEISRYLFLAVEPTMYVVFLTQLREKIMSVLHPNAVHSINA